MKQKFLVSDVEQILNYTFKNKKLIETAFTHSSYANMFGEKSNERLEFLGDTVLSTIISEKIYLDMDYDEGQLSKLRAKIVSLQPIAKLAKKLGVDKFLKVTGSTSDEISIITDSMRADLIEAIIGAIYIDGGFVEAKNFVKSNFDMTVKENEKLDNLDDFKSYLQEHFTKESIKYVATKTGSDHKPIFNATVYVNGVKCGKGQANSKKKAEQIAASDAVKTLTKV